MANLFVSFVPSFVSLVVQESGSLRSLRARR